jgi:DNA-binding response OmpR family regulator
VPNANATQVVAEFKLSMPARQNPPVVAHATSSAAPVTPVEVSGSPGLPTGRKRILLVEGDGFTRLVLLLRLRLAGFVVDFTSNGILGLGKLRHCQPDILLVELKLCGLSGLELIKAARAEPTFGDRPIYVFTHAERMNRSTRKEVAQLATELLDKTAITREDLVQIFTGKFLPRESVAGQPALDAQASDTTITEMVLPGAIEELVAGVREQADVLVKDSGDRIASASELLSRVSSLGSCASAAGLANLARQTKALQDFVGQLRDAPQNYTDARLETISRAVEVMGKLASEKPRKGQAPTKFNAVFVDESPYSNRAIEEALLNAGFLPVCFEDPGRARQYLVAHRTQLVVANVALPEAHGLAIADIRQIPAQVVTPILFAPDRVALPAASEELPLSAPRLDKSPLLLAELVLRALNEVQSSGKTRSQAASVPPKGPTPPPAATTNALPADDGFNLFAQARPTEAATPVCSPIQSTAAAVNRGNRHTQFNELFAAAGIPSEPICRAEPEVNEADGAAIEEPKLPEDNSDHLQMVEPIEEAVPLSTLIPETEQQLQAAPNPDDMAPINWLASPASEPDTGSAIGNGAAEFQAPEAAALTQPAELTANDGEIMNTQLLGLAEQRSQARCAELEQEVAALRQALEGLNGTFAESQQTPVEASPKFQELEQRLSQQASELEQQTQQQQRLEAELRQQLEAKAAALQQTQEARQQAEARCAELEQESAKLRQDRQAAADAEKAATASAKPQPKGSSTGDTWAGLPASELEQQIRQGVAALARATAELAKERGERQRAQQLAADLNGRLQTLHQDFSRTLQIQGEHLSRISSLEQGHDHAKQALDKSAADLEQHQAERGAAEEQLHKSKESNTQLRKDVAFFEEANKRSDAARHELQNRLESSLSAARENEARLQQEADERKRLAESLDEARREIQEQARKHDLLQQELKTAHDALHDRDARLQKETAERQQLSETLGAVQRGSRDNPDRDLEFSKVQSALQTEQVERKRQESQMARMRQTALDAAHAARSLRAGLRRQIREPVDNLVHSTRSLLELEMGEEQKKLAEAVLQDVLLVQTRLREPGMAQPEATETNGAANPAGT